MTANDVAVIFFSLIIRNVKQTDDNYVFLVDFFFIQLTEQNTQIGLLRENLMTENSPVRTFRNAIWEKS